MNIEEKILEVVKSEKHFVLQGGAGSGKTESLKRAILKISQECETDKIACITYTNAAAEELQERINEETDKQFTICTIHSFLNDSIKNYRKNIHQVIEKIFLLDSFERKNITFYENDEILQKKEEHSRYKKLYNKYRKLHYDFNDELLDSVKGKRYYDETFKELNEKLNKGITELNTRIKNFINEKNYNDEKYNTYNEKNFDSLKDLTFGHDSLLKVSSLLFEKFPLLSQIIQDKYKYIFIDEYQDTDEKVIDLFINKIGNEKKSIIGLFGDSMQAIYEDGIGDVKKYVDDGILEFIPKKDNYRCSTEVIEFINTLRHDELKQEVALKDGEAHEDRKGSVKMYCSIFNGDKKNDKDRYNLELFSLIKKVEEKESEITCKKLILTNSAIAKRLKFNSLYGIFNSITQDVKEKIEKDFEKLGFDKLIKICRHFEEEEFNAILSLVKKEGFVLKNIEDKDTLSEFIKNMIDLNDDCITVLEKAFELKIIKKSLQYNYYMEKKDNFLKELSENNEYQKFKKLYEGGENTFSRIKNSIDINEYEFDDLKKRYLKEQFYIDLFKNKKVPFKELLQYEKYLNDELEYTTMHKTKGTQIENVLVVLDEFNWLKYNFSSIYDKSVERKEREILSERLFYVACSRAEKNLVCVKLLTSDEEEKKFKERFGDFTSRK